MKEQKHLYVVFSSTNCGIGRFVRFVTKNFYNHTSVSLDSNLSTLYSFARLHKNAPFYGGFVCESGLRYQGEPPTKIKVAALPLTDEQYNKATLFFETMKKERNKYLYNLFAAINSPSHHKVNIPNTFTCVEFAIKTIDLLQIIPEVNANNFYTINQLENILRDYVIYEDLFPQNNTQWGTDLYPHPLTPWQIVKYSLLTQLKLIKRLVTK